MSDVVERKIEPRWSNWRPALQEATGEIAKLANVDQGLH